MTVTDELERLADAHGHLTPELVVAEARHPDSPLHEHFEWDDSAAAERWRREQARQLIIQCRVTVSTPRNEKVTLRRYTALPVDEDPTRPHRYVRTAEALRTDRDLVIERARVEVDRLRRKYEALIDFDEVLKDVLAESA